VAKVLENLSIIGGNLILAFLGFTNFVDINLDEFDARSEKFWSLQRGSEPAPNSSGAKFVFIIPLNLLVGFPLYYPDIVLLTKLSLLLNPICFCLLFKVFMAYI
jgi:hypothetical protein